MNETLWLAVLTGFAALSSGAVAFIVNRTQAQIDRMTEMVEQTNRRISALELKVAENHPTRLEMDHMEVRINAQFEKVNTKLDQIFEKLDTKQDKVT